MSIRRNGTAALAVTDDLELSISMAAARVPNRVRYITVRDQASEEREALVRAVFGDPACFAFADEGTFAVSRAHADYDVLIIDAVDPLRMARYLRANRALLGNVVKFAVMHESSPPRRARMLAAGCDDVFDSARMSPEEAGLRVRAVMRWHHARKAVSKANKRAAADMAHFSSPGTLTQREIALLAALAQHFGKPISAQRLCRLLTPPDPVLFTRSLKHTISRLRGKLYPQWRIEAAPGRGYALLRVDVPNQSDPVPDLRAA